MKKITSSVILSALTAIAILPAGVFWLHAQVSTPPPAGQMIVDDSNTLGLFTATGKWMKGKLVGASYGNGFSFATNGKARWKFAVKPGAYSVDVSQTRLSMVSPLYTYVVSDGVATIGSFSVDQRVKSNDHQSVRWKNGGTFSTTTSTLIVELETGRSMVIADAVRITPVDPTVASSASSSSVSSAPAPRCGDGLVNNGEQCDSGAMNGQPCMAPAGSSCVYCSASCIRVYVEDFKSSASSSSVSSAPAPRCGDGLVNNGEQCDKGLENGRICDSVVGGSCEYCSADCQTIVVKSSRCGDGIVSNGEQCDDGNTIETDRCDSRCMNIAASGVFCADSVDNDVDGKADVVSLSNAQPYGQTRRVSLISTDNVNGRSYFMLQDEKNNYQTIEVRDSTTLRSLYSTTFEKTILRRDVFGSPQIDPQTKFLRKPFFYDMIGSTDGTSVFALIGDYTTAYVSVEGKPVPQLETVDEAKIVRFSADLSRIESVLDTGTLHFPFGSIRMTPDGKTLVAFVSGTLRKASVPSVKSGEFTAPSIVFIDAATFNVRETMTVPTADRSFLHPLKVENDRLVYAVSSRVQPSFIQGLFAKIIRKPIQVVEYVPSTRATRSVETPFHEFVGVSIQSVPTLDGKHAFALFMSEEPSDSVFTKQRTVLARINLSSLAVTSQVTLSGPWSGATRLAWVLSNGLLAGTRTRVTPGLNAYDEELVLFRPEAITGSTRESETLESMGTMMQTLDGSMIRTNLAFPRDNLMSYDAAMSRVFHYDGTQMTVQYVNADPQCVALTSVE